MPSHSLEKLCDYLVSGASGAQEFHVYKEKKMCPFEDTEHIETQEQELFLHHTHDAGRYYCKYQSFTDWSEHSDPLELVVPGLSRKSSLLALPSPVMTTGGNMTLQYGSEQLFDQFILIQEGDHNASQTLNSQPYPPGRPRAQFPVGLVTPSHRWTFRCYGCDRDRQQGCSQPSDALELRVSGLKWYQIILIGVLVALILLLTLLLFLFLQHQRQSKGYIGSFLGSIIAQWWSLKPTDTFLLSKEGTADPPLRLRSELRAQQYQAEFSMRPVTSAHGGTYRCYSSQSTTPYLLSHPSEPLELLVSGEGTVTLSFLSSV
ncbi:leukocyte immunoglobulin-like receptor subfamily A member 6 [Rhynchonycteris naso]